MNPGEQPLPGQLGRPRRIRRRRRRSVRAAGPNPPGRRERKPVLDVGCAPECEDGDRGRLHHDVRLHFRLPTAYPVEASSRAAQALDAELQDDADASEHRIRECVCLICRRQIDRCNVFLDSDDPGDHNSCPMYGHIALKHVFHATCPAHAAAGGEGTRGRSGTLHGDGRLNERNGFARIRGGRGLSEAALVPRGAGEPER